MKDISVSYVSNFPIKGDSPKLSLRRSGTFHYYFVDNDTNELIFSGVSTGNETIIGARQWFTNWAISVENDDNEIIFVDFFNAENKTVFIKMDAYALGDNIAWIPYIEEFRKKHKCNIICSTFWNFLFEQTYPDILFVKPNTEVKNVYAQFYIGATKDGLNTKYCPITTINNPLQMIASISLGLEHEEIRPIISRPENLKNNFNSKYVCISEFASSETKMWKEKNGWQTIVDFLNSNGYKVVVISKEPTALKNIINKSGDYHINDRINDLVFCEFFMGVSSGLSWLAWGLNKEVVMISDYTPHYHEFENIRLGQNKRESINYESPKITSKKEVIDKLNSFFKKHNQ